MGKKNDASLLPSAGEGPKGTPESLVTTPWEDTLEARAAALLTGGEPLVLVTVVSRTGSAPREAGTRALQTRNGFEGTVGGGLLEARAMLSDILMTTVIGHEALRQIGRASCRERV